MEVRDIQFGLIEAKSVQNKPVDSRRYTADREEALGYKNEPPKPESRLESVRYAFALAATIPKKAVEVGWLRSALQKRTNEAEISLRISEIHLSRWVQPSQRRLCNAAGAATKTRFCVPSCAPVATAPAIQDSRPLLADGRQLGLAALGMGPGCASWSGLGATDWRSQDCRFEVLGSEILRIRESYGSGGRSHSTGGRRRAQALVPLRTKPECPLVSWRLCSRLHSRLRIPASPGRTGGGGLGWRSG